MPKCGTVWTVASGLTPSFAHSHLFLALDTASPTHVDTPAHLRLLPSSLLCSPLRSRSACTGSTIHPQPSRLEGQGCVCRHRGLQNWDVLGARWGTGSGWTFLLYPLTSCPIGRAGTGNDNGGAEQGPLRCSSQEGGRGPGQSLSCWKLYFSGSFSVTCCDLRNRKG